jgi:hypothetical protein
MIVLLGAAGFGVPAWAEDGEWFEGRASGFWGLSADTGVFEGAISKFGLSSIGGRVEEPQIDKLYSGYRFNELFAVEGAQTSLKLPPSACSHDILSSDLARSCHGASWSVSGVATLPFQEGLSFYGRLGMQYWGNQTGIERSAVLPSLQDLGTTVGFGISYEFRKHMYLHADTERYSELGGLGLRPGRGVGLDSSVHSIGLSIRF